eukprot:5509958-Pleurochrysis_carterae.AAC.5
MERSVNILMERECRQVQTRRTSRLRLKSECRTVVLRTRLRARARGSGRLRLDDAEPRPHLGGGSQLRQQFGRALGRSARVRDRVKRGDALRRPLLDGAHCADQHLQRARLAKRVGARVGEGEDAQRRGGVHAAVGVGVGEHLD